MFNFYPNQIGFINNKKSISSSVVANEVVTYILEVREDFIGKRLVINTAKGNSNGILNKTNTIIPELPYRILINDSNFLQKNKTNILSNYPLINFYNPGIVATEKDLTLPNELNNKTTSFIELNLGRDLFKYLKSDYIQQTINGVDVICKNSKFEIFDIQASMVVENELSSPQYDNLIITVVSRIDHEYTYVLNNKNNYEKNSYSLPVTILIKVDRNLLTSTNNIYTLPYSWHYPVSIGIYGSSSIISIGKINQNISTSFTTNMWNYNLLALLKNEATNKYYPISFGCLTDSTYIETNSVAIVSSIGYYITESNDYNRIFCVSISTLSSAGYNTYDRNKIIFKSKSSVDKLVISKIGNYYFISANTINAGKREVIIFIYGSFLQELATKIIGSVVRDCDIVSNGSKLYLFLETDFNLYLYKFSNVDSNFVSSFNNTKYLSYDKIESFFSSLNSSTLIVKNASVFKKTNIIVYFLKDKYNNDVEVYINGYSLDKSMLDITNFGGDFSNLKLIDPSILALESINRSDSTIINTKFFKVN